MPFKIERVIPANEDRRGSITDALPPGVTVAHVGVLHSVAGSGRGNHYHLLKDEWMFLVSGCAMVGLCDHEQPNTTVQWFKLNPGDRVSVPRGFVHAFQFIEDSVLIDFGTAPFDPTDMHPLTVPPFRS